jgi:hypothetical protein
LIERQRTPHRLWNDDIRGDVPLRASTLYAFYRFRPEVIEHTRDSEDKRVFIDHRAKRLATLVPKGAPEMHLDLAQRTGVRGTARTPEYELAPYLPRVRSSDLLEGIMV